MIDSSSPTLDAAPVEAASSQVNAALGELERIAGAASSQPVVVGFDRVLHSWMLRNPAAAAQLLVVSMQAAASEERA